ncbi:uncharacterized protein [Heterodontus francisci]|uniref:uncharacterized protein n=1 Tax=Heterodontus francisci TaxID=7792 RepID=UPI00355B6557
MNSLISDTVTPLQTEGDEEFLEKGCEHPSLSPGEADESGFFEELLSDSDGEAKLPTGTEPLIATESDIDLTAQLVPSGGLQSHPYVTTLPISETGPLEVSTFEYTFSRSPCVYAEAGPIRSIPHSDYTIPHAPAGHDSSKTLCEEMPNRGSSHVKTLASSTIPFSLGTSPKPGLIKGNVGDVSVQGPIGRLFRVVPDNTMQQGQRAQEPTQNANFMDPETAGIFSSDPKTEGWILGENEDLYCETGGCGRGSVDLYTDPSQKREEHVAGAEEGHEPQRSASAFFENSVCQDSQSRSDFTLQTMGDAFHPERPDTESDTAGSLGESRMSQKEEVVKKTRKKRQRNRQPFCPSNMFIRKSIKLAHNRITREHTAQVLDEFRRIYIEGFLEKSQFFDLLDSGLALSNQGREHFMDKVIVTMRDGNRLALSPAKHGSISYYRPCVEFHCVQQLGNNWFRVKDTTTGQLLLMKKETVLSDWRKGLQNFLRLQPDMVILVPYAVVCDRKGSILYLTQDREVIGFGRPRGLGMDHRKLLKRCIRFLNFCWYHGLHPGDFNSNIVYCRESIYFDPTSLTGLEDQYTFSKSLKAAYSLLVETGFQEMSFDSFLDTVWHGGEDTDSESERLLLD